jgi:acyl dehydratase
VPRRYWEDFAPGQVDEYGPRLLTREEIIAFAAEFDPKPMHLDAEAAVFVERRSDEASAP